MDIYESAYHFLFADQLIAAEPDYEEWFCAEFNPDNIDWNDEDCAKSALSRLLDELYESCDNYEELLEMAGLAEDDLAALNAR